MAIFTLLPTAEQSVASGFYDYGIYLPATHTYTVLHQNYQKYGTVYITNQTLHINIPYSSN